MLFPRIRRIHHLINSSVTGKHFVKCKVKLIKNRQMNSLPMIKGEESMLARFENGYFLEVEHNSRENEYRYAVYDDFGIIDQVGWTEYRDIELYYPINNVIDYLIEYCNLPDEVKEKYIILPYKTFRDMVALTKQKSYCLYDYTEGKHRIIENIIANSPMEAASKYCKGKVIRVYDNGKFDIIVNGKYYYRLT